MHATAAHTQNTHKSSFLTSPVCPSVTLIQTDTDSSPGLHLQPKKDHSVKLWLPRNSISCSALWTSPIEHINALTRNSMNLKAQLKSLHLKQPPITPRTMCDLQNNSTQGEISCAHCYNSPLSRAGDHGQVLRLTTADGERTNCTNPKKRVVWDASEHLNSFCRLNVSLKGTGDKKIPESKLLQKAELWGDCWNI